MFDALTVHTVLDVVADAVIDGGWGIDALAGRQTRPHDDLDLVVPIDRAHAIVEALTPLGVTPVDDERPTRVVVRRADGSEHVDLHLVDVSAGGSKQTLPGGLQFTYMLDDTTGTIDGRSVRCLSPAMQLLTHAGYEPDDDDRADIAVLSSLCDL